MTVFPKRELNESMLRELKTNGKNYRSACGKVVPDLGGIRITGYSESGILRTVKARVAEVQKPLVSASQTADKVTAWIARKGQRSYLIPAQGKVANKIQKILDASSWEDDSYLMQLHESNGTYNFWLNTQGGSIASLSLEEEARTLSRSQLEQAYTRGPQGHP